MIKMMVTWKDNPNKTVEENDAHYLGLHTQMGNYALHDVPGFLKYVQNRVVFHGVHEYNTREVHEREPDFDRSIELYFADEAAFEQCYGRPELDAMYADHLNFIHTEAAPSQKLYRLEERVEIVRGRDGTLYVPAPRGHFRWPK